MSDEADEIRRTLGDGPEGPDRVADTDELMAQERKELKEDRLEEEGLEDLESREDFAKHEEDEAASEARDIGGHTSEERMDPAERASAEAGGGVAEGFEQSEEQLRDEAENFDSGHNPAANPSVEEGSGADPDTYGEADHERSSEDSE